MLVIMTPYPLYVKLCIRLLLIILIIVTISFAQELLIPFVIAGLISFILLPVVVKLEDWSLPRSLASLAAVILAILVFLGFVYFLYTQIQSFADDLPELKTKIDEKSVALQRFITEHFDVSKREQLKWLDKKLSGFLDSGDRYLLTIFTVTASFITNLILIPLYVYFLIVYRDKVAKFITLLNHRENYELTFTIVHKISVVAQKYLKGLMLDACIVFTLTGLGFILLGIKHAILFALLVSVFNIIIPYMGLTVSSVLPFLMTVVSQDHFGTAFGAVGVCVFMQFVDNHFINPYVVGMSVRINPLTCFLALVASAIIWGVYGMLLCIPVLGMIKVICDHVDALKPYGYIIGHETVYGEEKKPLRKIIPRKKAI
jgi:predicted PurR-regulated permease PerM